MHTQLKRDLERVEFGEFWTSKQRQSHNIHYAVSYRASFKPELPSFFINEFLNKKSRVILDPFGGRGTTTLEANLLGHYAIHNDISPISIFLASSRQTIPSLADLENKLNSLDLSKKVKESKEDEGLLAFFHKDTLKEIKNLKQLYKKDSSAEMQYIMLTALSRLHGHSPGFFSVYTFPQFSISPEAQKKNNIKRNQTPEYRAVKPRILAKMKRDLSSPLPPFYHEFARHNIYSNHSATNMFSLSDSIADLAVTSPPFLDKVDYIQDNWMKTWFLGYDKEDVKDISIIHNLDSWTSFIQATLKECSRVMKKKALFVIEVGEVKKGKEMINLDELVIQASKNTNMNWVKTYINSQSFTKLSNCWNVSNNKLGTNTNRCVVFENLK
ncbi:MAG: site-specific DNA-methyltransferase [Leptospiraceae bacterium]|nr:site-specific DNA-methyltransferase [Leptospiraceae bacterium]MCP5501266.1 site-specific DNA-methyltransferase [Leptospiraceae bacterium]